MRKVVVILLAFLLTGTLVLFCVSYVGRQVILPAMSGEDGAQVSEAIIREEKLLVRERVTELSELYGFDAEPVIGVISEDILRDLNRQASRWWSTLLQDGKAGDELRWDISELEDVLASDASLNRMEDQEQAEYMGLTVADEVYSSVNRMVLPMRQQIIRLGMQKIGQRIDTVNLITFFMRIPWAALALCALLAGLLMLLRSRKPPDSLQYIGAALGGAALVLACLLILYQFSGILPMIREASAGLAIQYQSVASEAMIRAGILTAAMAMGCTLCMIGIRKSRRKA